MSTERVYESMANHRDPDERRTSLSLRWSELELLAHCARVAAKHPEATEDPDDRKAIDLLQRRLDARTTVTLQIEADNLFQLALLPGEVFASAQAMYAVSVAARRFFKKWSRSQTTTADEFLAAAADLFEHMYGFSPGKYPNRFAGDGSIFEAEWRDGPWTYRAVSSSSTGIEVVRVTAA